jgi:NADPH-dependent 2,4-dienoyl-CoA reductase/sulfur reductase-like enzyme
VGKVTRRAFLAATGAAAVLATRAHGSAAQPGEAQPGAAQSDDPRPDPAQFDEGQPAAARHGEAQPGGARPGAARVIVVGGGFAGAACALELRARAPALEVLLVDPDDRYVTCPMSNSVIAGLRAMSSITVPRSGLARGGVRVVPDSVVAIDPERKQARLRGGAVLAFDRLVLAAGIRFLWGHPEGYTDSAAERLPHAWQAGKQTQLLAAQLAALRPGGVVAISVPAGPMRCPPGPFERASLMAAYLARRGRRAKVLIFDANNHFPRQDAFSAAWQELYPGTIEWIPMTQGGALVRVDPGQMMLYSSHGAQRADVINIIPPQAPASIAVQAGLASDHGWCPVDPSTFESTLVPGVHVIGDACIADPMPKAASSARAQARQCARALAAAFAGAAPPPPGMESVCYSLLARDRALSIHARFETRDGVIESLPAAAGPAAVTEQEEARNAASWYRRIVAESFGI